MKDGQGRANREITNFSKENITNETEKKMHWNEGHASKYLKVSHTTKKNII